MTQDEPKQGYCLIMTIVVLNLLIITILLSQMTQRDIFHRDGKSPVYARNQL